MNTAAATLRIDRDLPAPPDAVFAALTTSALLGQWMAPGSMTVVEAVSEPVVGGRYRIVMRDDDGSLVATSGVYREVVANERLVHTWQWDGSDEVTTVEIDLTPLAGGHTRLSLTHSRFADQDQCDRHGTGWHACLDKLTGTLERAPAA